MKRRTVPGIRSKIDYGAQVIHRTWGDLDVVDAEKELRVFIAPEDIEKATEKDPAYCIFAQACRRQFHATRVLFFRAVAYIELPTETGQRRVERFHMGREMRDLIESFDRGQGVIPNAGFTLQPPPPGQQLEHKRLKNKILEAKVRERRKLQGKAVSDETNQGKGKYRDGPLLVDLEVRSGTGAVHFARPSKKESKT